MRCFVLVDFIPLLLLLLLLQSLQIILVFHHLVKNESWSIQCNFKTRFYQDDYARQSSTLSHRLCDVCHLRRLVSLCERHDRREAANKYHRIEPRDIKLEYNDILSIISSDSVVRDGDVLVIALKTQTFIFFFLFFLFLFFLFFFLFFLFFLFLILSPEVVDALAPRDVIPQSETENTVKAKTLAGVLFSFEIQNVVPPI